MPILKMELPLNLMVGCCVPQNFVMSCTVILPDYDYVNIQGTIENNEEEECFEVMINDDPIPEVRQYFTIHLNSSDPFVTTVIESARVNIDDDVDG